MKLLIAAGGTGGHVFPGLAVAEALVRLDRGSEALFIGTATGLEQRAVPKAGFRLLTLRAQQFLGRSVLQKLKALAVVIDGVSRAVAIIRRERPQAILGMGGFTSVPAVLGGCLLKVPTFLHEQNVVPGLANRFLARFVRAVFVSFPETTGELRCRQTVHTGNPLRKSLVDERSSREGGGFGVFVFGGSRGARSINDAVLQLIPLMAGLGDVSMYHQTGTEDFERVGKAYAGASFPHEVFPFTDTMARYYNLSSVVICRAGATTIFELACFRKPAILIPYPFSAGQHQWKNAAYVEGIGGAFVLPNDEASGDRLYGVLKKMMDHPGLLDDMGERFGALYIDDSAERIVKGISHGLS